MKQEYPGDIRPLLNACESLARERRGALERLRTHVHELKTGVTQTLGQIANERAVSQSKVRDMTRNTVRRLHETRLQRSANLQRLRDGFQLDAKRRQASLRATLTKAREAVQASVEDIRARTANARLTRFRSGSFDLHPADRSMPPRARNVARGHREAVRNNEVADFLDSLGPDGSNSRK